MPALRSSTSPGTDPGAVCLCTHADMANTSRPSPARASLSTASSRGIGAATARLAARRGHAVCDTDVRHAMRTSCSPSGVEGSHAGVGNVDRTVIPRGPLVGIGTPEECAAAILWLLSEEAVYVTGAILPVTGGR